MIRFLPVALAVALATTPTARPTTGTNLVNLGTNSFAVDASATTAAYTQNDTALIFGPTISFGGTLGGLFPSPRDWTPYNSFGLLMSSTSTDTNTLSLAFNVDFYGAGPQPGDFVLINTYEGEIELNLAPSLVPLGLIISGTQNFSSVVGMQFTWGGGASATVSVSDIVGLAPPTSGFFVARAPGGVQFLTGDPLDPWITSLDSEAANWEPPSLAALPPGSTSWALLSDSNAKTAVTPLDGRDLLQKIATLPVTEWQYSHDPDRRYLGPMAQDFHAAFGLGSDDTRISTIDTDGVTLAALQGLLAEIEQRKKVSAVQGAKLARLEAEIKALQEQLSGQPALPPVP